MIDRAYAALGRGVVRFRWVIIAVWVIGTVLSVRALPSLSSQVNNDNSKFLPTGAPSNQAATLAEPLIGNIDRAQVIVVVSGTRALGTSDMAAARRWYDSAEYQAALPIRSAAARTARLIFVEGV